MNNRIEEAESRGEDTKELVERLDVIRETKRCY